MSSPSFKEALLKIVNLQQGQSLGEIARRMESPIYRTYLGLRWLVMDGKVERKMLGKKLYYRLKAFELVEFVSTDTMAGWK